MNYKENYQNGTPLECNTYENCTNEENEPENIIFHGDILGDFYNNKNIKYIRISENVQLISEGALQDSSVTEINFDEGSMLTRIEENAFKYSSLTKIINFPTTLNHLGASAFESTNITTIDLTYTEIESIPVKCFKNCNNLISIYFNEGLLEINDEAFLNCTKMNLISLPEKITSIGESSFQNTGVNSIVIPKSVINIGRRAFYGSEYLESVILNHGPNDMLFIGDECFVNTPSEQLVLRRTTNQTVSIPSTNTTNQTVSIPSTNTTNQTVSIPSANYANTSSSQSQQPNYYYSAERNIYPQEPNNYIAPKIYSSSYSNPQEPNNYIAPKIYSSSYSNPQEPYNYIAPKIYSSSYSNPQEPNNYSNQNIRQNIDNFKICMKNKTHNCDTYSLGNCINNIIDECSNQLSQ